MLSDETLEKVIEVIVRRIEEGNTYTLEQIGKSLNKIGTLTPSKAQELGQILKYGGDYDKITKKLAQITKKNVRDIKKIFEEVAKKDLRFAKQFYDYRGKKFIPYEQNGALKRQVQAISKIMIDDYISRTKALGITMKDTKGNVVFKKLNSAYKEAIDRAILSVSQGKSTFQDELYRIVKEMGNSGLKSLVYESGRTMRFDSAVKMQMKDALRTLHNETQMIVGEQFDANMVEVSHHSNSAPDHIDTVDGKQFAMIDKIKEQIKNGIEKEIKLEDIKDNKVKVNGKWYDDFNTINSNLQRPVSTLNCYHYTFTGILGINKPQFTKEELEKSKQQNMKGFEYENKHYTLYEGSQLMRNVELELRKSKDMQIMARASGETQIVDEMQQKISILTHKYRDIIKVSGLPSKISRARVPNYKRIRTS